MKKEITGIILALVALFGFTQATLAQLADVPTPTRQAQRMTDVMSERLELSEDQTQKVLDLNLRLAETETALLDNKKLDYFERLEKLREITETRAEELKGILNDQQYQKFNELNNKTRNDKAEKKQSTGQQ